MRVLISYQIKQKYPDLPEIIPDSFFDENWADKIHGQTLKRLNERGGLAPVEMICNIEKLTAKEYYHQLETKELTEEIAIKKLLKIIHKA